MSDMNVIKEITDRINHISMTLAWKPRNNSEKESYEKYINNIAVKYLILNHWYRPEQDTISFEHDWENGTHIVKVNRFDFIEYVDIDFVVKKDEYDYTDNK